MLSAYQYITYFDVLLAYFRINWKIAKMLLLVTLTAIPSFMCENIMLWYPRLKDNSQKRNLWNIREHQKLRTYMPALYVKSLKTANLAYQRLNWRCGRNKENYKDVFTLLYAYIFCYIVAACNIKRTLYQQIKHIYTITHNYH